MNLICANFLLGQLRAPGELGLKVFWGGGEELFGCGGGARGWEVGWKMGGRWKREGLPDEGVGASVCGVGLQGLEVEDEEDVGGDGDGDGGVGDC